MQPSVAHTITATKSDEADRMRLTGNHLVFFPEGNLHVLEDNGFTRSERPENKWKRINQEIHLWRNNRITNGRISHFERKKHKKQKRDNKNIQNNFIIKNKLKHDKETAHISRLISKSGSPNKEYGISWTHWAV